MDTSYRTSLELNQKQQLSQSQIQSLNILALDNGELSEFLQNEYIENPILDYSPSPSSYTVSEDRSFDIPAENTEEVKTFLLDQLNQNDFTPMEWQTMKFMIDCLDSGGFFKISVHELSVLLTIPEDEIRKCYDVLSDLEPAGIFSENLSQCLLKQLEVKGKKTDILETIILDHLDDIALGHISTISRKLKLSTAEVRKNIAVIRNLNSKPLQGFSTARTEYITPDIIVTYQEDQWDIRLNDDWVGNYSLKDYFKKKYERCRFIIASIEQRRQTMLKITEAVLARQPDFFLNHGCLKPMTMNDVAGDIDMHVSTVSRGIKGKYLQFPCGIVSMRSLFSGAAPASGASVSTGDIKMILKELVASEDPRKPYSDQKLCNLLKDKGISISRRTVAKYREQMGIKGTYDRKET